jgi:hypothetical protein
VRDLTNLSWADEPFGASRRPSIRRGEIGVGIHIEWSISASYLGFDAAYLRFPRRQSLHATGATLPFGFRSLRIESPLDEAAALRALSDLLVAARRGACLIAGAALTADLLALRDRTPIAYRGIAALASDWPGPATPSPGLALLVDTDRDLGRAGIWSHDPLVGSPPPIPEDAIVAGVTEALLRLIRAGEARGRVTLRDDFNLAETVVAALWDFVAS